VTIPTTQGYRRHVPAFQLRFFGHSTVLVTIDGVRILTDPVLGGIGPLRHHAPTRGHGALSADVIVVSHGHRDHLDLPSLHAVGGEPLIVVPAGLGQLCRRAGLHRVEEVVSGDLVDAGEGVTLRAFPALHDGGRPPMGPRTEAIGFVFEGSSHVYFAGDTDVFPQMGSLRGTLDLALMPVWGWGPNLGPGHMDPGRAAEAVALLRPRVAVPVHWGGLFPRGMHHVWPHLLVEPPREFARHVREAGTATEVCILKPGESMVVEPRPDQPAI